MRKYGIFLSFVIMYLFWLRFWGHLINKYENKSMLDDLPTFIILEASPQL